MPAYNPREAVDDIRLKAIENAMLFSRYRSLYPNLSEAIVNRFLNWRNRLLEINALKKYGIDYVNGEIERTIRSASVWLESDSKHFLDYLATIEEIIMGYEKNDR